MKRSLLGLLVSLFMVFPLLLKGQSKQLKKWDKNNPLTWADFTGPVDSKSLFEASTRSGDTIIYYSRPTITQRKTFVFTGYSYIVKNKCWARPAYITAALLRHEQGAF